MEKLTILCVTYNQEKFVRQTLDSFVMQKTNFPFEAIIGDDCSTDGTIEILKEYAEKYPNIIKPIFREKNLGAAINSIDVGMRINSQYVAICEGDDYWTDENKLQKQVDFLDNNPDFSICFHNTRWFFEDGSAPDIIFPSKKQRFDKIVLGLEDLLKDNFISTNSVLYRWRFNDKEKFQDFYPPDILPGDWFIHLLHAQKGKIGFIDEVMGAYRMNSQGIWWNNDNEEHLLKYGIQKLKCFTEIEKNFPEYLAMGGHTQTIMMARHFFNIYLKHYKFNEIKKIIELCPDIFPNQVIA